MAGPTYGQGEQGTAISVPNIISNSRQQLENAWRFAVENATAEAMAQMDLIMGRGENAVDSIQRRTGESARYTGERGGITDRYLSERGRVDSESAGRDTGAYISALIARGQALVTNIMNQGAISLDDFLRTSMYNLDLNRQITGPGHRPGYSGERRFAPTPSEEQVRGLPQYSTIQQRIQADIEHQNRMTGVEVEAARSRLSATQANIGARTEVERGRNTAETAAATGHIQNVGENEIQDIENTTSLNVSAEAENFNRQMAEQERRMQEQFNLTSSPSAVSTVPLREVERNMEGGFRVIDSSVGGGVGSNSERERNFAYAGIVTRDLARMRLNSKLDIVRRKAGKVNGR